jgi:hypothetical protein
MERATQAHSHRPRIEAPHEPIGIAPLRFTLDDEGLTIDDELIVGVRVPQSRGVRDPFLTDGHPVGAGSFRVRPYHPLAMFPGLFRVFGIPSPAATASRPSPTASVRSAATSPDRFHSTTNPAPRVSRLVSGSPGLHGTVRS